MLSKKQKEDIFKKYGLHKKDTGSVEVRIALLTEEIKELQGHLKTHKKDLHSRKGLVDMVGKRRKFLRYLSEKDQNNYKDLIKKIGLRK